MPFAHAVVWIDRRSARIIGFSPTRHEIRVIGAQPSARQAHGTSGVVRAGRRSPHRAFLEDVADAREGVDEILLCGPNVATTASERHVARRRPDVARHIVALELADRPTDALLAHARRTFQRIDRFGAS